MHKRLILHRTPTLQRSEILHKSQSPNKRLGTEGTAGVWEDPFFYISLGQNKGTKRSNG